jgi:D-beta-D-heptose 7-phosphate kinase / D-beta-D-heptose 1-phosphate adenosyltransferase
MRAVSYHLIDLVQNLGRPRILVLGDLILDRYTWGDAERISQEAPVILLRERSREVRLGGAANVANMLRGLEADVSLAGVIGNDADGRELRDELERQGVDCASVIVDPERPTTMKERFIGRAQQRHPHQILRVDREVRRPLPEPVADRLVDSLLATLPSHQAVLISDYGKGVCTPEVCRRLIAAARQAGLPVIVDPSSSGDCRNFAGATAVTPNRMETKRATGREIAKIDDAIAAGRRLCADLGLDHAFITLDSDGIVVTRADGSAEHLATRKREVYDITGAGDMVLAMIGVGAAAGIAPFDLARLANVAGGLEVEQVGVVPIRRDDLLADLFAAERTTADKVCSLDVLERHVAARRRLGNRIVLTNGCFDLLHVGHVSYLQEAAREGDCLIVAVNSDASVRQLGKGPDRPIFAEQQRAAMLAALEAVDYVTIFGEATPHTLLSRLKPDLLVKGGGYAPHEIVGHELVEAYGGQVKALGHVPGISSTIVLEQLRNSKDPTSSESGRQAA